MSEVPILTVWNKLDKCSDPDQVKEMAEKRQDVVCISSISGEGIDDLLKAIEAAFKVWGGCTVHQAQSYFKMEVTLIGHNFQIEVRSKARKQWCSISLNLLLVFL